MKPLEGIKVIELARVLAGPWAGQTLADLGADVLKIEHPDGGDDTRAWGPPFLMSDTGEALDAAYFHACNRGKRSAAIDFSKPDGAALVRRFAADADVLIENFKTGSLAKYGLDYDALKKINPRLIYCSITGFGQTGPYAARAGYDFIVQGMGGAMHLTGEADGEGQKSGVAYADIFAGLYSVIAIQAALIRRAVSGFGGVIDMALLDTQVSVLANQALNYLAAGQSPKRMGNAHPNIVPYQVFAAADGPLIVAAGNDRQAQALCRILGLASLADDPRYATNADRVRNRAPYIQALSAAAKKISRRELLAALETAGVAAGPINDLEQVFADPQVIARSLAQNLPSSGLRGGVAPSVRGPVRLDGQSLSAATGAPRLAEHTRQALTQAGLANAEIDALAEQGVIRQKPLV